MSRRPRATCPVCGGMYAVTTSGRMWAHHQYRPHPMGGFEGFLCAGTGRTPSRSES